MTVLPFIAFIVFIAFISAVVYGLLHFKLINKAVMALDTIKFFVLLVSVVLVYFFCANKCPHSLGLRVHGWFVVVSSLCKLVWSVSLSGISCGQFVKTRFIQSFWDGSPRHSLFTCYSNPPRSCGVSVSCCWTVFGAYLKKLSRDGFLLSKSCFDDQKQTTPFLSMGNESPSPIACCWYFPGANLMKTHNEMLKKELARRADKDEEDRRNEEAGISLFKDEEADLKTVRHPQKFTIAIYSLSFNVYYFILCWYSTGIVLAVVMWTMDL